MKKGLIIIFTIMLLAAGCKAAKDEISGIDIQVPPVAEGMEVETARNAIEEEDYETAIGYFQILLDGNLNASTTDLSEEERKELYLILYQLGRAYFEEGYYSQSKILFERLVEEIKDEDNTRERYLKSAACYYLTDIYLDQDEYGSASKVNGDYGVIGGKIYPNTGWDTAVLYNDEEASISRAEGNFERAFSLHVLAIKKIEALKINNRITTSVYQNTARSYYELEEYDMAYAYMGKSILLMEKELGLDSNLDLPSAPDQEELLENIKPEVFLLGDTMQIQRRDLAEGYWKLSDMKYGAGEMEDARTYCQRAAELYTGLPDKSKYDIINQYFCLEALKEIHESLGMSAEAAQIAGEIERMNVEITEREREAWEKRRDRASVFVPILYGGF